MDQNPSKCRATISGRDRISELPDAIICEILSKLSTKDAVATTILSKRWKGQWNYCFNLDFRDIKTCFDVIALNKSPYIKKLRLHTEFLDNDDLNRYLDYISKRKVEAIELFDPSGKYSSTLPQSLFTCQTLVFLDISSNVQYYLPPSIHLPSLKVFHASIFNPVDEEITKQLFCNLPVLEDLSISFSYIRLSVEEIIFNIFTPSLKRLKLELDTGDSMYDIDYQIVVRAPSLKELDIFEYPYICANYVFEELPLDFEARLRVAVCNKCIYKSNSYVARTIQLMNGISGVKSLAISGCIFWGLLDFGDVAVFPNITCLEVEVTSCCGFTSLPSLIDKFPNLVSLVLKMKMVPNKEHGPLEHESQCLMLHLKIIEVRLFKGQEYELKLLGYLLKVAPVLDEVVIYTPSIAIEERKNFSQKLSSFPCCSKNCQFKILEKVFEDEVVNVRYLGYALRD